MTTRMLVVTPARNEVEYLPHLIEAVRAQTRLPDRWIVIDDGSTDGTGDLVRELCADLPWVDVLTRPDSVRRALAEANPGGFLRDVSKANGVNEAIRMAMTDETEMIVTFDADVVPPPHFLEVTERAFADDPKLGIFGGVYTYQAIRRVKPEPFPVDIVPGGLLVFRRAAYDDVGGFMAMPYGGIDHQVCIGVQLHGWTTRHDPSLVCEHLRPLGTGEGQSARRGMYRRGREDYDLGAPLWFEMGKCIRWIPRRPFVAGSLWMAAGFLHSTVARTPHTPSADLVAFNKRRARARVLRRLRRLVGR